MTKRRHARRQKGAVLIEAIMVLSVFVLLFGGITFMHRVALASIEAQQEAKNLAYSRALQGCVDNEMSLAEAVGSLRDGDLPIPGGILGGGSAEGTASRSALGLFGRGAITTTSSARMPCNTRVSSASESGGGAWLTDMF